MLGQRPSQLTYLRRRVGEWECYQFDNAVMTLGMLVENATHERVNLGSDREPNYQPKYRLAELLTPGFKLEPDADADIETLRGGDGVMYDEVT